MYPSNHGMKQQQHLLPSQRPTSVISPPPQRPPPRRHRPKSHCAAPPPRATTTREAEKKKNDSSGLPSFAVVPNFDHCPVTKRPTRSFEDTKLRIPNTRQRVAYLESQCKCYAKADSGMTNWIKRVSAKGPPKPVLEGYTPLRRQSLPSLGDLESRGRARTSSSSNSPPSPPQPSTSLSMTLSTFFRKASGSSMSSSTRRPHNALNETPRPSLSRLFRPQTIKRLSISMSTKPKGTITKEKITTKADPSLSSASPPLYPKPSVSSMAEQQHQHQQQVLSAKRWRPGSVVESLRIPSSTKSENTRRPISIATVVDRRVLPLETRTASCRQAMKVAENTTRFSQSLSQRKRTIPPSMSPMYISTAWR